MNCCCESGETKEFKIEGDVGADPIWCNQCGCNLDIEDIPISEELAEELSLWAAKYGEWIDWKIDKLLPNGIELEDKFNQIGVALTEKLKRELGGKYKMTFMPSSSARFYPTLTGSKTPTSRFERSKEGKWEITARKDPTND